MRLDLEHGFDQNTAIVWLGLYVSSVRFEKCPAVGSPSVGSIRFYFVTAVETVVFHLEKVAYMSIGFTDFCQGFSFKTTFQPSCHEVLNKEPGKLVRYKADHVTVDLDA